ncbi:MAG: hypothetical protein SGI87_06320 [Flavobacteriales bacterium]|nr:hypothetical protein [Flavobacteriales bacterium]
MQALKKTVLLFIIALLFSTELFAQVTTPEPNDDLTPKYVNEFLNIGVGARALGMSQAQIASADDVTSGYWNPAGLNGIKGDLQVAAMHAEYFAGIAKFDYAAIGKQIDSASAASISFMRFGVDDIPNTIELVDASGNIDYNRITTFSAADYAFVFSYGRNNQRPLGRKQGASGVELVNPRNQNDNFSWGVNAKVIYRQLGDFARAWGFGLDAGAKYRHNKWIFAAMARDVTSTFNAWSFSLDERTKEVFLETNNIVPENSLEIALPRVILGAARVWEFNKFSLLTEINAEMTTDGQRNVLFSADPVSIDPRFGFELGYRNVIFVRGGLGNIQRIKELDGSDGMTFQPNMGLGIRIKQLQIDYALSDVGNASDVLYSNIFSLRYDIFKSRKQ